MKVIETQSLSKYYGRSRGIIDLNLSVEEGQIFGFIGPNGAGKSTTIRILLGLISPSSGQARIFGKSIAENKLSILSRIGYMPSEATFYRGMKVSEILKLSASLYHKDCQAEARRLCDLFEVDTKKKVETLSLGNRKKVSIICAFQHSPDLYILDEPTSGLDPFMQKAFFELLHERHRQGATFFLSSHVLSEIQRHCQNAAVIREGRLAACDSVERLSGTQARRVVLHGTATLPTLSGIKNPVWSKDSVSFLYQGDMKALLTALQKLPLTDLSISEAELEEIFMHFYEKEEK
ncbi:MAG: ABC transporter ATP-binding protein [Eubacteriales bacterium]|nr:ABC transporter ATP-binding protein [Eubacteriales bacterium]